MAQARSKKVVSLWDFILTGKFGDIEVGQTKDYILKHAYKPDEKFDMGSGLSIWRYSAFELHFIDETLNFLWCDNLFWLNNPKKKQFHLYKSVFNDMEKLSFSYFCKLMNDSSIEFSVFSVVYNQKDIIDQLILHINNSNTEIYFQNPNDDDEDVPIEEFMLVAIGAVEDRRPRSNFIRIK